MRFWCRIGLHAWRLDRSRSVMEPFRWVVLYVCRRCGAEREEHPLYDQIGG